MKLGVPALRQKQQQAEAGDFVTFGEVRGKPGGWQLVKGLELLDVASKGFWVAGADGEECALLVRLSRHGEQVGRGIWRGGECIEAEQSELGFGKQAVCLLVAH